MTISQSQILTALNGYAFENIWNEPLLEYAENIQLFPVSERFMINWIIQNKYLPLPVNQVQYAVYRVSMTLLEGSLIIPWNTWVATDTISNQYQTLFHVYTNTGIMLPKSSVFLYHEHNTNMLYVAAQKTPFISVAGVSNFSNMYLSVYRYLQTNNPLTVKSFFVPNPDTGSVVSGQVSAALSASLTASTPGTNVYVNGYDIEPGSVVIGLGSYIDIITDTTVMGVYSVDLTTTNTGYFSTTYDTYKQVLHCPKSLNPNNNIITNELISLVARRNLDNVGLYITKSAENSLTQITHNDVALNTEVVNAMRATLGAQDISIEVKIRFHQNKLIREINYIDYLYICDDAVVLDFLIGDGDPNIPFWTATTLEQSAYVSYMTASTALTNAQTVSSYVAGLGYYTVLSVLCQQMNNYPVVLPMSNISVAKPLILSGLPAYPVVYINGLKVRDSSVGYSNTRHDNILIGFQTGVYYTTGQTITVDVIEAGANIPYLFTPVAGTQSITVPFQEVQVFQVNTLTNAVSGYDATSNTSCTPIPILSGGQVQAYTSGSTTEVVFSSSTYGNTYLIQNSIFSRSFGFDITSQVTALTPLHVELTTLCTDGVTVVPFVGYNSLDVYLNGSRLIPGIDYSANPALDANNNPAIIQILICNMSFINLTLNNYVEVIARTGIILENTIGYMANNMAGINNMVEFWYGGMSEAFIGGSLQINPTDAGNAIMPNPAIGNATPFYILAELPNLISEVLNGYTSSLDDSRITLINAYFDNQTPENNISTLIIPESWKLYSPYLTAVYNTVMQAGETVIYSNDPDDTLFLSQFESFNYLKLNDPTVNANISKIDLRFCDINPSYGTITVPNLNTYAIMQRLETLMLTSDTATLGDVFDG